MKKARGFFKLTKLFEAIISTPLARRMNQKPARLGVECLEARETPTTYTWTPTAAGTFDWNNAANWGGAGFPNGADDVANINNDIAAGTQIINAVPRPYTEAAAKESDLHIQRGFDLMEYFLTSGLPNNV